MEVPPIRVLGVDIGIRNLSVCLLEIQQGGGNDGTTLLERAVSGLRGGGVLDWEVSELCPSTKNANKCGHATILDGLVDFVRRRFDVFEWATHVVIEAQPNARMKMLSGALYALVRELRGDAAKILFHPARRKLTAWGKPLLDYAPEVRQRTYLERKKGAVALMTRLLTDCETHVDKVALLASMRKKDDAADSFLHALSYAVCLARPRTPARALTEF
jgi:hypothetical protein